MANFYVLVAAESDAAASWVKDILTALDMEYRIAGSAVMLRAALDDRLPDVIVDVIAKSSDWVIPIVQGDPALASIPLLQPLLWSDVSDTPRSAAGLRAVRLKSELETLLHDSAAAKKAEALPKADDFDQSAPDWAIDNEEADEFRGGILQDLLDRMDEAPAAESDRQALPASEAAPIPPLAPKPIAPPAPIMPGAPEPEPAQTAEPVQFSTYYPREIKPDEWQPLLAYLFRESAADAARADAQNQLGETLNRFRTVSDSAARPIAEGATVVATPQIPGFRFNPPSISIGFYEVWHRFDFKLMAKDAPLHVAANGQITFTVEGVIVADIPLSVFVTDSPATQAAPREAGAKPYQAIFASYSRDDSAIVERVEKAYKALGLEYLRDLITIRSGEDWTQRLGEMIDQADIFQLFWSSASSASAFVKMEWQHALRRQAERPHFIRPVYWENPMPDPPAELMQIHFTYQPDLVK